MIQLTTPKIPIGYDQHSPEYWDSQAERYLNLARITEKARNKTRALKLREGAVLAAYLLRNHPRG